MKIPVGVLGATGIVGQRYLMQLSAHPLFEIVYLAASERSSGKTYEEAVMGRWHLEEPIPERLKSLLVYPLIENCEAISRCRLLFSALDNEAAKMFDPHFAARGFAVVSNASWGRKEKDIPIIIPEVNESHLSVIKGQQKTRGWKGFVVTKPCCTVQSYTLALAAIHRAYPLDKVIVTSLQAVSGAGFPGISSLEVLDNVVPFIRGEEEKCEEEPLKILGTAYEDHISKESSITISASCNRVPVVDGHLVTVSFSCKNRTPSRQEILNSWSCFPALKLASAPHLPIHYVEEEDRPQPRKDRGRESGMAVVIGRLRPCPVLDFRFVGLSHNTIRGAAGGGLLIGELLVDKGLV